MVITKEETFGPVAALPLQERDEAITMANDTEFGLASYFYSRDIGRIWRVAEAWNTASSASTRHHLDRDRPLRRHEGSGIGRPSPLAREARFRDRFARSRADIEQRAGAFFGDFIRKAVAQSSACGMRAPPHRA